MAAMQADTTTAERQESVFAVVNNIPSCYHSADLRNYFSQFIESGGFHCFHFRHRPEVQQTAASLDVGSTQASAEETSRKTTCCIVKLAPEKRDELIRMYHKKHWLDKNGDSMRSLCLLSKIKVASSNQANNETSQTYKTRAEQRKVPADRVDFTEADLLKLPELNPPELMPHGNVGTPTKMFLDHIRQCRLPPGVIKKLGLVFPRTRPNKMYGSVPFDYGTEVLEGEEDEDMAVVSASGHVLERGEEEMEVTPQQEEGEVEAETEEGQRTSMGESAVTTTTTTTTSTSSQSDPHTGEPLTNRARREQRKRENAERRKLMNERIEEKMVEKEQASDSGDDNDTCEEWERHEATDDDPTSQGRCKERLFEEEIELKWEKGGSGLVFYTDAQYWQELEGDFDEQTADDLNVDMSAYYEDGAGDKDIRDFLTMRQETRRRLGKEATDRFTVGIAKPRKPDQPGSRSLQGNGGGAGIGKFERHTKGIGRRLLERQGWSEGQGLGKAEAGIPQALENEGQHPRERKGLGFHGEKLLLPGASRPKKPRREPGPGLISTVYDRAAETDPPEPLLRRNDPTFLKHRGPIVEFTRGGSSMDNG